MENEFTVEFSTTVSINNNKLHFFSLNPLKKVLYLFLISTHEVGTPFPFNVII